MIDGNRKADRRQQTQRRPEHRAAHTKRQGAFANERTAPRLILPDGNGAKKNRLGYEAQLEIVDGLQPVRVKRVEMLAELNDLLTSEVTDGIDRAINRIAALLRYESRDVCRTQIFTLHRTERLTQSAKRTQFQAMEQNEANSDDFNGCWLQG